MGITVARPQRRLFKARLGRIRSWVSRQLGDTRHEQRVAQIAVSLFDLLADRHGLRPRHRRFLKLAALMHDIGRAKGAEGHHLRGEKIVLNTQALGLSHRERLVVAYLTRYHRGPTPDARQQWLAPSLERPRAMHRLLALLRAADALDSRKLVTEALTLRLRGSRIRIRCFVGELDQARQTFGGHEQYHLLERTFHVRVNVQLRHVDPSSVEY